MDNEIASAGFTDLAEPEAERLAREEAQKKIPRLDEVQQLLVPLEAQLPEQLEGLSYTALDLVELGHAVYDATLHEKKIYFLKIANDVATVALAYPTLFRLKPAVVEGLPGTDYHPRFKQAVFGCPQVSWGYIVDSLGLDDKLRFDTGASSAPSQAYSEDEVDAAESGN